MAAELQQRKPRKGQEGSAAPALQEESKWAKASRSDATWEKQELLDVVHWVKQLFGILCGVVWGVLGLTGSVGNLSFVACNVIVPFLYYNKYLNVDDEDMFGGRWPLIQEGFFSSYALFLVSWILTFNALHVA
ncbi:hypothetical protein QOT17_015546 [Balamuthia mandrillaris]